MLFDGDYFRRIFALLFRGHNRQDIIAYLQYRAIAAGAQFCTKALDEEFFDFYSRKLGGQKEVCLCSYTPSSAPTNTAGTTCTHSSLCVMYNSCRRYNIEDRPRWWFSCAKGHLRAEGRLSHSHQPKHAPPPVCGPTM